MEKKKWDTNLGEDLLNASVGWREKLGLHEILNELPRVHIFYQRESRGFFQGSGGGIRRNGLPLVRHKGDGGAALKRNDNEIWGRGKRCGR